MILNGKIRNAARSILPERVRIFLSGIYFGWHGNYSTWEEAMSLGSGYNSSEILNKVTQAAIQVRDRKAAFERDSVLFYDAQPSYELLSMLMWIAARNGGKLNVMDFGGSLGSTYYQNRRFLDSLPDLNWCVVEQNSFVETGKKLFRGDKLHFFFSIEECTDKLSIDVVLFSSVLQYLEKPYDIINDVIRRKIKYIIIDRTPFTDKADRITLQRVPPHIYKACYPCRFFNKKGFLERFPKNYTMKHQFKSLDKSNIRSEFLGMVFEREDN